MSQGMEAATFTYASVCDGISAVSQAWHPLGWRCAWVSEIDPFCCALIGQRWGHKNLGDMLAITEEELEKHGRPDVFVGGTPCQSFSVAGLRKGLDDPRGNLALRFCQLAGILRPRWVVWENVPGVLSSGKGEDFGSIVRGLEELGYGVAWRSLDAQYFGVAQRRERVFAVGHLGDWRPAAAVLLEPEGLCGDSAPSRETRQDAAGWFGDGVAGTLQRNYADKWGLDNQHVDAGCPMFVPVPLYYSHDYNQDRVYAAHGPTEALTRAIKPNFFVGQSVRRLTPTECERLQGFSTWINRITVRAWFGHDGTKLVRAEVCCRNAPHNVLHVEDTERRGSAWPAEATFLNDVESLKAAVAVHVRIGHAPKLQRVLNRGKCIWSASGVEESDLFPLSTPADDIALAIARLRLALDRSTHNGRVESPPNTKSSTPHQNGNWLAVTFGPENAGVASDATYGHVAGTKSTTESSGQNSQPFDLNARTLLCSVVRATTSFIPKETLAVSSCEIVLDNETDYTAITYRNKPAADGPRYAALGNSMAVPCMHWIGKRIQFVNDYILASRKEATR